MQKTTRPNGEEPPPRRMELHGAARCETVASRPTALRAVVRHRIPVIRNLQRLGRYAAVASIGWSIYANTAKASAASSPSASAAPVASVSAEPPAPVPIAHASSEERKTSISPKPAAPPPSKMRFVADPLSDGAVLVIAFGFVGLSQVIISSGELKPQQPVASSKLSAIDRFAITQTVDPNAGLLSNLGLYGAITFAVIDPVITGVREESAQAMLVDAILYLQSAGITGGLTNLTKIAVRRPRPRAYIEWQRQVDAVRRERAGYCRNRLLAVVPVRSRIDDGGPRGDGDVSRVCALAKAESEAVDYPCDGSPRNRVYRV